MHIYEKEYKIQFHALFIIFVIYGSYQAIYHPYKPTISGT